MQTEVRILSTNPIIFTWYSTGKYDPAVYLILHGYQYLDHGQDLYRHQYQHQCKHTIKVKTKSITEEHALWECTVLPVAASEVRVGIYLQERVVFLSIRIASQPIPGSFAITAAA